MPFKIDGVYCRLIPLTKSRYAIVWESDYEWLMRWKWYAIVHKNGYMQVARSVKKNGRNRSIYMYREIVGVSFGDPRLVDHENCNPADNRRSNLRPGDKSKNGMNRPAQINNTSGYKGVSFHAATGKWLAQIVAGGAYYYIGLFDSRTEAADRYSDRMHELHKEFGRVA